MTKEDRGRCEDDLGRKGVGLLCANGVVYAVFGMLLSEGEWMDGWGVGLLGRV